MQEIYIEENDANMRIDRFLKKYLPQAPSSVLYKGLRKKNILLNGKKAQEKDFLKQGDKITIYFKEETLDKFRGDTRQVRDLDYPKIVKAYRHILIMAKPAGVLSHPGGGGKNILDQMLAYARDQGLYDPKKEKTFAPALCNRLDRNTSGLIIGALSAQALRDMNQALRDRRVKKYYLALVHGQMKKEVDLSSSLTKDRKKNQVVLDEGGHLARAIYRPLRSTKDRTLVEVDLITGRTHQIRKQLQVLGHPILGDRKYGLARGQEEGLSHQALHAYKLVFPNFQGDLEDLSGDQVLYPPEGDFERAKRRIFHD
ncbi:MAG: RluA family pseudouridine synthase [Tissierellia bacterium]|nr:RluA family pseudouridine synthase [Tissierellia bacterium]